MTRGSNTGVQKSHIPQELCFVTLSLVSPCHENMRKRRARAPRSPTREMLLCVVYENREPLTFNDDPGILSRTSKAATECLQAAGQGRLIGMVFE